VEYTLSLALVDFLPVFFTAVGLVAISRMVAHVNVIQGRVAFYGTLFTIAGGFFKATWKLLMASSNGAVDIRWLDQGLFVFMAPGYTLLAWSVWQTVRTVQGKKAFHAWIPPLVMIGIVFTASVTLFAMNPTSPAWERILLSVMVLATVITGIFLLTFAFRQRLSTAGWLFILNLIGIFLLNGLARLENQPIFLQWIEESINTLAWLAFAIASNQVYGYTRLHFGVDPDQVRSVVTS
jgi:hypothetical protein